MKTNTQWTKLAVVVALSGTNLDTSKPMRGSMETQAQKLTTKEPGAETQNACDSMYQPLLTEAGLPQLPPTAREALSAADR